VNDRPAPGAPAGEALVVGLDIGGTKTLGVAVDAAGGIAARVRLPSGHGPGAVVEAAVEAVRRLREAVPAARVDRVGIGIPGTVDHRRGEVQQALNLGLEHLALGPTMTARTGLPVHVENDVNTAALGAMRLTAAVPSDSLAYLNLGTGVAAGLVLGGRLWRGSSGAAGEIGHVPLNPAGPACVCGEHGCLEVLASGSGIARQWGGAVPPAAALWRLAADGDPRAAPIAERLVAAVAAGVRLLVLTYDVERVVVGGGLAEALGERLLDPVLARLRAQEAASAFLGTVAPSRRVLAAPADVPLAALGAAFAAEPEAGPEVKSGAVSGVRLAAASAQ